MPPMSVSPNEGHLELSNLMLLKGMIQGGSVGSKDVTLADVRQDASIEAEKVQFKELNNAGTVKVIEICRYQDRKYRHR